MPDLSPTSRLVRPNRSTQLGLFLLAAVGGLALAVVLSALNPRNRAFFGWGEPERPGPIAETGAPADPNDTAASDDHDTLDGSVPPTAAPPRRPPLDVRDLPVTLRPPDLSHGGEPPPDQPPSELGVQIDRLWATVLSELDDAEQQRLRTALSAIRQERPALEADGESLRALITYLDHWWGDVFQQAEVSVALEPAAAAPLPSPLDPIAEPGAGPSASGEPDSPPAETVPANTVPANDITPDSSSAPADDRPDRSLDWEQLDNAIPRPRTERQREQIARITAAIRGHWDGVKLGLLQLSRGQIPSGSEREAIRRFSDAADRHWLSQVSDRSHIRFRERHAWFRLVEAIDRMPDGVLEPSDILPVTPLELRTVPQAHRGEPITLTGQARLGYFLPATLEDEGVDGYHIVWFYPTRDLKHPMVVYLLEPPPSFPKLANRRETGEMTPLGDRPIEVRGVFFKQFEYLAGEGPSSAPLILARTVVSDLPPQFHGPLDLGVPVGGQLVAIIVAAIVGAGALTWWIWRKSEPTAQERKRLLDRLPPPKPPRRPS